jgi:hypothetical protein
MLPHSPQKPHLEQQDFFKKNYIMSKFELVVKLSTCLVNVNLLTIIYSFIPWFNIFLFRY